MKQQYNVGIYVRLSKDDERITESLSIENQKFILRKHIQDEGWNEFDIYVDDGFTGVNFERPAVKRLIADVKRGKVNFVLCKDLSRFGRNHLEVGSVIDEFVVSGVRFVALKDNIDSNDPRSMEMMPVMNLFNEYHSSSTSKKIRAVIEAGAKSGKYRATKAPYGYVKGTCEKRLPVIDEPAAVVVRRIFEMRGQAISPRHIADALNADGVPIPSDYESARTGKVNKRTTNHFWCGEIVKQILNNPTYLGELHMLQTKKLSYKHKKVVKCDESEQIIHRNTHEAIVSRELWDRIREIEASVSQGKKTKVHGTMPLSGLMLCGTCGNKMRLNSNNTTTGSKKNPRQYYRHNYTCGSYSRSGKEACSSHYIKIQDIEQIVLEDIRSKVSFVLQDETKARRDFIRAKQKSNSEQIYAVNSEFNRSEKRVAKLDDLIRAAFEEKVGGIMPEEICVKLLNDYKSERETLVERIAELRQVIEQHGQVEYDVEAFIRKVKKYVGAEELTREMTMGLIDHITIGERDVEVREIHIYYKQLGEI
jgi:DNA invertase Pin-like site-specific DNA recombinase